jgi:putative oxidoreductase
VRRRGAPSRWGVSAQAGDAEVATLDPVGVADVGDRVVELARRCAPVALRLALGVVFVWFGLLKLFHASPAAPLIRALIAATVPVIPAGPAVVAVGMVEVVIGLGFLSWMAPRATLMMFMTQMAATFGTLVFLPGTVFQRGDPLLLSMSGEFVVKNVVLLAAGLAALAAVPTRAERRGRHRVTPMALATRRGAQAAVFPRWATRTRVFGFARQLAAVRPIRTVAAGRGPRREALDEPPADVAAESLLVQ